MNIGWLNDASLGVDWLRILSTGGILTLVALLAKAYIDNRRLTLQHRQRADSYKLEVSADGRTNLQFIIDNLQKEIVATRERHDDCERRVTRLHRRLRAQERAHDGLHRQFVEYQLSIARAVPPSGRSAEINAMIESLELIVHAPRKPMVDDFLDDSDDRADGLGDAPAT